MQLAHKKSCYDKKENNSNNHKKLKENAEFPTFKEKNVKFLKIKKDQNQRKLWDEESGLARVNRNFSKQKK